MKERLLTLVFTGLTGMLGAIVQAQVIVGHLVDAPPDLVELEAAGIPFAIAMLVSGDVQAGPLWRSLRAVQQGQVYPVSDDVWMLGIGVLGAEAVLADLERTLR